MKFYSVSVHAVVHVNIQEPVCSRRKKKQKNLLFAPTHCLNVSMYGVFQLVNTVRVRIQRGRVAGGLDNPEKSQKYRVF